MDLNYLAQRSLYFLLDMFCIQTPFLKQRESFFSYSFDYLSTLVNFFPLLANIFRILWILYLAQPSMCEKSNGEGRGYKKVANFSVLSTCD